MSKKRYVAAMALMVAAVPAFADFISSQTAAAIANSATTVTTGSNQAGQVAGQAAGVLFNPNSPYTLAGTSAPGAVQGAVATAANTVGAASSSSSGLSSLATAALNPSNLAIGGIVAGQVGATGVERGLTGASGVGTLLNGNYDINSPDFTSIKNLANIGVGGLQVAAAVTGNKGTMNIANGLEVANGKVLQPSNFGNTTVANNLTADPKDTLRIESPTLGDNLGLSKYTDPAGLARRTSNSGDVALNSLFGQSSTIGNGKAAAVNSDGTVDVFGNATNSATSVAAKSGGDADPAYAAFIAARDDVSPITNVVDLKSLPAAASPASVRKSDPAYVAFNAVRQDASLANLSMSDLAAKNAARDTSPITHIVNVTGSAKANTESGTASIYLFP